MMEKIADSIHPIVRIPEFKLKVPTSLPSASVVLALVIVSYFFVTSGIIYDMIVEPPAVGQVYDQQSGQYRPETIVKYRINGQYIIEGMTAGFLFVLGGLAIIAFDYAKSPSISNPFRWVLLGGGSFAMLVAYNMLGVFIRMKVPNYLAGYDS